MLIRQSQAITIVHYPQDLRLASYTYLANIYSLLISALASMLKGQLTQNDAVFVLVATVSPATVYFWAIASFAIVFKSFPQRISREIPNAHEQLMLTGLSCIS